MTDSRARSKPALIEDVITVIESWLERPNVSTLDARVRHWRILREVAQTGQVRGPLVTDAHIAALTIEHGAVLATNDRDFTRFPRLKVVYPLLEDA
jgi:uncharacterized protein